MPMRKAPIDPDHILSLLLEGRGVLAVSRRCACLWTEVRAIGEDAGLTYHAPTGTMLTPSDAAAAGTVTRPVPVAAVSVPVACRTDPDLFFSEAPEDIAKAKRICGFCSSGRRCLEYALAHLELAGIWGGTTEAERGARTPERLIAQRKRVARQREEVAA